MTIARPLNVLMLSRYEHRGASSRLRFEAFRRALAEQEIVCDSLPFFDDRYVDHLYATGNTLWPSAPRYYLRRLGALLRANRYDLIWLEKEALPWLPWGLEQALYQRIPYVVDYDDAWHLRYARHPNALTRRLLRGKIEHIMRGANAVIAGNDHLATIAAEAGAGRIEVIPTCVDTDRYRTAGEPDDGRFTIGWIGSPTTTFYLATVADALETMGRAGARLHLIGARPIHLPSIETRIIPWSEATEAAELAKCQVGIMPLLDGPWERGKCSYKIIQYMAAGLPAVASPVGGNRQVVVDGTTGFLAADRDAWVAALTRLRDDPAARRRMGDAARARAVESYDYRRYVDRIADVLRGAAHRRPKLPTPRAESKTGTSRVLHVITGLGTGGAETVLRAMASDAHRKGREVAVVSLLPGGDNAHRLRVDGVETYDLGMTAGLPSLRALVRLARIIRRFRPATIQSWMYHADLAALLGVVASGRRRRTRLYWGIRCSDMNLTRYSRILAWTVRTCARWSTAPDAVVANSHAGVRVHRRLGYTPREWIVIHNGVDTAAFAPDAAARAAARLELGIADDRVVAITVARVDPMKNYDAIVELLRARPDLLGIAVGRGTEGLPTLENLIRLGRRDDVARLLNAADIFVSTSAFGEGFSNVVAEAMACGLPVVATDVGDAAIQLGAAGRIVPPLDAVALRDSVVALAADAAGRRELGAAARARIVALFSQERCFAAFDALHTDGPGAVVRAVASVSDSGQNANHAAAPNAA
ncbi:MAG: glycosyltransferase [Alphaproteobacteria bacterium]